MLLEATLHRIGGVPEYAEYPRQFGPRVLDVSQTAVESRDLPSSSSREWVNLWFDSWAPIDDDWISCRIRLTEMAGHDLGTRPAVIYRRPWDVPTYTLFQPRWPEPGVFSLGLRMLEPA